MALRPDRASSYNNVLTSADGGVANVEGSATDAEVTGLDEAGHLVHTNHYVCERMLPFEGDPEYAKRSAVRYRAGPHAARGGRRRPPSRRHPPQHARRSRGAPDSICRHPEFGSPTVEDGVLVHGGCHRAGRIRFGRGNPCDSVAQDYGFANYPAD